MAKNLSGQQFAQKWSQRVSQSGDAYKNGVNSVQTAPGVSAAAQKDVYVQNVQASADKWAQNVSSVSLQSWKQQTLDFGTSKYTAGGAKGMNKMQNFGNKFIPFVTQAANSLPPRGNS